MIQKKASQILASIGKIILNMRGGAFLLVIPLVLALLAAMLPSMYNSGNASEEPAPPVGSPTTARPTARVTFPEGLTVMQTGELLEQSGVCGAEAFYAAVNSVDFGGEFDFLPAFNSLKEKGRPYLLEGYLFPDTYEFYLNESPESVVRRFLKNFGQRIPAEIQGNAADVGAAYGAELDFDDILILASIVEKEISANPDEMPGVAAVFLNRIKYPGGTVSGSATGGFFQSDVTKFYPYVYKASPEGFVSEYNTFNVKGLPKGPICNPSLAAIKAVLNPDRENEAFFFYTDKNAKVYYAVTFKQHNANWQYCKENNLVP